VMLMRNFVSGANEKNHHLINVNPGRDFQAEAVADLRKITTDDPCPVCGGRLELTEGIEVGHIFKLGTSYSEKMQAVFQDKDGLEKPFVMGCYGIGVSRVVAAAIEQNHDENGIIFPVPLAPYKAIILNLDPKDEKITEAAESLYAELSLAGMDVLLDDRDERPGAKFKDADLLGMPFRVTVGKKYAQGGIVELRNRKTGESAEMPLDHLKKELLAKIADATVN
jgi:prolyl-tRNA synthetase